MDEITQAKSRAQMPVNEELDRRHVRDVPEGAPVRSGVADPAAALALDTFETVLRERQPAQKARLCTGCGRPRDDHKFAPLERIMELPSNEWAYTWYLCDDNSLSRGRMLVEKLGLQPPIDLKAMVRAISMRQRHERIGQIIRLLPNGNSGHELYATQPGSFDLCAVKSGVRVDPGPDQSFIWRGNTTLDDPAALAEVEHLTLLWQSGDQRAIYGVRLDGPYDFNVTTYGSGDSAGSGVEMFFSSFTELEPVMAHIPEVQEES